MWKVRTKSGIKEIVRKVLYLLSFVVAAIITCLVFNFLIYDVGLGSGAGRAGNRDIVTTIKGESLDGSYEEIKLMGILHMEWNLMKVTNVIFNNGCIYLNSDGVIMQGFKYDYPYSLRHMQETVKNDLNRKYRSKEMDITEIEDFLYTYFSEVDYSERNKTLHEMMQRKKIEVYDVRASKLSYQELQRMMKLIEERGIDKIVKEENWFIGW